MADKPKADEIRKAAEKAGISVTEADAAQLEQGKNVPLKQESVKAVGKCSGIKIVDLGKGCGLYLIPFPPQISVCCEM